MKYFRQPLTRANLSLEERMNKIEKNKPGVKIDYVVQENLRCHLNLQSAKMVFLANGEDFLYLRGAIPKARRVGSFDNS